jgi:hypothetical protein
MSYQVIKQPDGKLAIFSSETDSWEAWNLTPRKAAKWFAGQAAQEAGARAQRVIDAVLHGEPPYSRQAALTFAEANARSRHYGGEVLDGPVDAELARTLEGPLDDPES